MDTLLPAPAIPLVNQVRAAFDDGGAVSLACKKLGRSYARRHEQVEYAFRVASGLALGGGPDWEAKPGGITLLEAETGVGKSLGYLVPLLLFAAKTGKRCFVSTYTRALRRQIFASDMPVAIEAVRLMTGQVMKAAERKSVKNFVSPERVEELGAAMREHMILGEEGAAWVRFETWAASGEDDGDIDAWIEAYGRIPAGVSVDQVCLANAREAACCDGYQAHLAQASGANVVIVTHAMLMRHVTLGMRLLDKRSPDKGWYDDDGRLRLGIIDEADRLPAAADLVYDMRIPMSHMRGWYGTMETAGIADSGFGEALGALEASFERSFAAAMQHRLLDTSGNGGRVLFDELPTVLGSDILFNVRRLSDRSKAVLQSLKDKRSRTALAMKDYLTTLAHELEDFELAASNKDHLQNRVAAILQWSPVRSMPSLGVVPIEAGRLAARMWRSTREGENYLDSVILTSATLGITGASGSLLFGPIMDELGINRTHHLVHERLQAAIAPRKFGSMEIVLADRAAPSPTAGRREEDIEEESQGAGPDAVAYWAAAIQKANKEGGRVLVLVTSHTDRQALQALLEPVIANLLVHERGTPISHYDEPFRADPNAVLISAGAWEGVDYGNLLRHVVVTRIPYPPMDGGKRLVMQRYLRRRGFSEDRINGLMYAKAYGDARRRLRQGIGRGIRTVDAKVKLWILDPRFPVPDVIALDRRRRQANRWGKSFLGFMQCVPMRFREGAMSAMNRATIFLVPDSLRQDNERAANPLKKSA